MENAVQHTQEPTTLPETHKIVKHEKPKSFAKYLPMMLAGLGFGAIAILMKLGVVDYNKLANLEEVIEQAESLDKPTIKTVLELAKDVIDKIGMNTIILGLKGFQFGKAMIGMIRDSIKPKELPQGQKIKQVQKNDKDKASNLLNIITGGLNVGVHALLMLTGNINFNNVFDWSKLPSGLAKLASSIDMNSLKLFIMSLKLIPNHMFEGITEQDKMALRPKDMHLRLADIKWALEQTKPARSQRRESTQEI